MDIIRKICENCTCFKKTLDGDGTCGNDGKACHSSEKCRIDNCTTQHEKLKQMKNMVLNKSLAEMLGVSEEEAKEIVKNNDIKLGMEYYSEMNSCDNPTIKARPHNPNFDDE